MVHGAGMKSVTSVDRYVYSASSFSTVLVKSRRV
jgi:hypothetical protein